MSENFGKRVAGPKVLVTGATGFIGGRLVERLIEEHKVSVCALVRDYATAMRIGRYDIEIVRGDLTDVDALRRAMRGCDLLFNCAHDSSVKGGLQREVALRGIGNVCRVARESGISQMVHLSTYAVYAPVRDGELSEDTPWPRCRHPYVEAKRATERYVLRQAREHALPAAVLQPTMVYGPYGKVWTSDVAAQLRAGVIPLVDGGMGLASTLYVDDLIDAMLRAVLEPRARGEVFLISGEDVCWKRFYGAFEQALDVSATVEIPASRVEELARRRRREQQPLHVLLSDPQVLRQLRRMRTVKYLRALARTVLPRRNRLSLQSALAPVRRTAGVAARHGADRPLHVPSDLILSFYRTSPRVHIDKARRVLGYRPQYDFEAGMRRTAEYLQWANLA